MMCGNVEAPGMHGTWHAVGGVDEFLERERASWDER